MPDPDRGEPALPSRAHVLFRRSGQAVCPAPVTDPVFWVSLAPEGTLESGGRTGITGGFGCRLGGLALSVEWHHLR